MATPTYKKVVAAILAAFCLITGLQSAERRAINIDDPCAQIVSYLRSTERFSRQPAPGAMQAVAHDVIAKVYAALALESVTQEKLDVCLRWAILVSNSQCGMELLQKVIAAGGNVNHCDAGGYAPLPLAMHFGRRAAIKMLLQHGAFLEPASAPTAPADNVAAKQPVSVAHTQAALSLMSLNQ